MTNGPGEEADSGNAADRALWRGVAALVLATGVFRLLAAWWLGFGVDEAYAVAVARPLSASYFDHPPLVFWLAGGMEWLTGSRAPGVLRLPFVLLFALTQGSMAALTRHLFGAQAAWWTVAALSVTGVLGYTGASWVLPDGPLLAGLAVSAWAIARACFTPASADGHTPARPRFAPGAREAASLAPATGWWLLAGVGAGVAGMAKYHAIFLPLGVLAFLVVTRQARVLRTPGPWLAAALALACTVPVFAWNASHDWASFRFQLGRAGTNRSWRIDPFVQAVVGQIAYILPWVWGLLVWAAWRTRRVVRRDARVVFLLALAAGPILVFTGVTLTGASGLPHWQAPGYLFLLPLLGAALADRERAGRRWPLRWLIASAAVQVALVALIVSHATTGWVARLQPAWFAAGDPAHELLGWDDLGTALAARGAFADPDVAFVAAPHWIEAAKAGAAVGDRLPVLALARDGRHFPFARPPADFVGRDGLLVHRRGEFAVDSLLAARFASVAPAAPIALTRGRDTAFVLDVWRVRGLRAP